MPNIKNNEILLKIIEFFSKNFDALISLDNDDNIFDLGLVDSLFAMKVVMFVEGTFGLECNDEDLDVKNFCSINNIHKFVEKKLATAT